MITILSGLNLFGYRFWFAIKPLKHSGFAFINECDLLAIQIGPFILEIDYSNFLGGNKNIHQYERFGIKPPHGNQK